MLRDPEQSITDGFDLHVIFQASELQEATKLFDAFLLFVQEKNIPHIRPKIFQKPVGPWPLPMWQVILPHHDGIYENLGRCTAWFMLNRSGFSVMIHPNSREEDGIGGELEDHTKNMIWLGEPAVLKTEIF